MNKRAIAALTAIVLAAVGVIFLINYAGAANDRAYAGAKLESVLQVTEPIAANTKAADIAAKVESIQLPHSAVAKGAISNLTEVSGLLTTTELEPGEQLLLSRFAATGAEKETKEEAKSDLPKGSQEITIPMGSARAVGDSLKVGDTVGIIASYQTREGDGVTQLIRNRVLVLKVARPAVKADGQADDNATQMITLAVTTRDAGKIVNALEFGKVWLTKQNKATASGHGGSISRDDVTK
jgi:pilus assembly protein CpaB